MLKNVVLTTAGFLYTVDNVFILLNDYTHSLF